MVQYINLQTALCPKCKEQGIIKRCSSEHLDNFHQLTIDSVNTFFSYLQKHSKKITTDDYGNKITKPKNRKEMTELFKKIFEPNYDRLKKFFCIY